MWNLGFSPLVKMELTESRHGQCAMFTLFLIVNEILDCMTMEIETPYLPNIAPEYVKKIQDYKIVPELTIRPPQLEAHVKYSDGSFAKFGNIVTEKQLKDPPDIRWAAEKEEEHTIAVIDFDHTVKHYNKSETHYAHWVIGNIPSCFTPGGHELISYEPPKLTNGSQSLHRILYLVYYQLEGSRDFYEPKTAQQIWNYRMWFNIHNLTDKYLLVGPIAMNFVLAPIETIELTTKSY